MLIKDREAHRQLIEIAKKNNLQVWYCAVAIVKGKLSAVGQQLIDWDSLQDEHKPAVVKAAPIIDAEPVSNELICPYCNQKCTSASGLTLHAKYKHGAVTSGTT